MENIINAIYDLIWNRGLIYLCLISGIYFSFKTKFSHLRNLKLMIKLLFHYEKSEKGISNFQSFCTALAGRIGTGNIAGVATAIALGGPGALFWMWIITLVGAGSAFAESTLGQLYKEDHLDQYRGGPAYYIEKGLQNTTFSKIYGLLFAIVSIITMVIFLPAIQSNFIANAVQTTFGLNRLISTTILVIITGFIVLGGIKKISAAAECIVPFMGVVYISMSLIIILLNIEQLPSVLEQIFKGAFGKDASFGGILGSTIAWGVKRGIYSNEAGQGTGVQASSAAEVNHPAVQGFVQSLSIYIDTLFICSATGFMILMTDCYTVFDEMTKKIIYTVGHTFTTDQIGAQYLIVGINTLKPGFGGAFITVSLFFFIFTSLIAYYYIAEVNLTYIVRKLNGNKHSKKTKYILTVIFLIAITIGSFKTSSMFEKLGDISLGIMSFLNIIAILILSTQVIKCYDDYENQLKKGIPTTKITFDPINLGIRNATFWEEKNYNSEK